MRATSFLFTLSFAEAALAEFHKKIKEAFEVFDHESNNTVDVRFESIFFILILLPIELIK